MIAAIRPWKAGSALAWIEYQGETGHDDPGRSQIMASILP